MDPTTAVAPLGQRLRQALTWPILLAACLLGTGLGMQAGMLVLAFNLSYLCLALLVWLLERHYPHEPRWLEDDGQMVPDLLHTLFTKGLVQVLVVVSLVMGLTAGVDAASWWPHQLPLVVQIALALVLGEFGMYWAHRLAHEWPPLWRFHAVHHSVRRLWFWNTGRFHGVDTLARIVFGVPLLWLAGAPAEVLQWGSAITAFIGMLTHANIDVRCGPLNYVFNTPELHRWHHSRQPDEGNRNYGENLVCWDLLFGTWFLPARRPPHDIGIDEPMPATFIGQCLQPFRARAAPMRNEVEVVDGR